MNEAAEKVIEFIFQTLKLSEIEGFTNPNNKKSIKILEKLNFKRLSEAEQVVPDYIIYSLKSNLWNEICFFICYLHAPFQFAPRMQKLF